MRAGAYQQAQPTGCVASQRVKKMAGQLLISSFV